MSSVKDYLRHLHVVYTNSLHEGSPQVDVPTEWVQLPLHAHQKAVLAKMAELEMGCITGLPIGQDRFFSNHGILGDSVGVGKSLMVLSHIARLKTAQPLPPHMAIHSHSSSNCFSIRTIPYGAQEEVGCLIIVPHTLFRQWSKYIQGQTKLSHLLISSEKVLNSDTFLSSLRSADVVLVSNTLARRLADECATHSFRFKRIFIDEADTIHLPGLPACGPQAFVTRFLWFISASWTNLLYHNQTQYFVRDTIQSQVFAPNAPYAHLSGYFKNFSEQSVGTGTNSYYCIEHFSIRSKLFLNSILSATFPLRSHLVVTCSQSFIQSSIALPPVYRRTILCKAPMSQVILANAVNSHIQQMLHAGDVEAALTNLGVKGKDNKTLVDAVTASLQKELVRLEKTYEFKASLEYSSASAKETALKSLTEKITRTKESIQSIEHRIEALEQEACPICYEDTPDNPLVTPCCSRLFCAKCLLLSMTRNPECPLCRGKIHPSQCTKFIPRSADTTAIVEAGTTAAADVNSQEPLKKTEALLKLIRDTPDGRFLIFSRYDNPFEAMEETMRDMGVCVRQLKGNKDMIAATLRDFETGGVQCLLLNSRFAGAGLNITAASHVVLFHAMSHEEEKQILGRAHRLGRVGELHFIKLLHQGEMAHSEAEQS